MPDDAGMKCWVVAACALATIAMLPAVTFAQTPPGEVQVLAYGVEADAYQVKWTYAGPTDRVWVRVAFTREADGTPTTLEVATVLPTAPFVDVDDIDALLRNINPRAGDCFHVKFLVTIILNSTVGPTGAHELARPICMPAGGIALPRTGLGDAAEPHAHGTGVDPRLASVLLTIAIGAGLVTLGLANAHRRAY